MNDETEKTFTITFPPEPTFIAPLTIPSSQIVEIELRNDGSGSVLIGGVAIQSMVKAVRVEGSATKMPVVILTLTPSHVRIKADADVFKLVESLPFSPEKDQTL